MSLKDEIDAVVHSAVSDMGEIREQLTALEHALPAVCGRTGNVRQIMMTLASRLLSLKVIVAKEVMLGHEAQAMRQDGAEDMELFAMAPTMLLVGSREVVREVGQTRIAPAVLASLHRANDHTLDDEEGAE